ncbi:MAG: hypothetical protein RIR62_1584 [Pseudomonadota bacterium]|jgi:predicted lipid-binding transport protein (Tim44 family)
MKQEDLDSLFTAARAAPPAPSDALMARVMADALAQQPARPRPAMPQAPAPRQGRGSLWGSLWGALTGLFGGAGAVAGMGGAAVAGLFIGLAQPALLVSLSDAYLGGTLDSVALIPSVDALFAGVTQ